MNSTNKTWIQTKSKTRILYEIFASRYIVQPFLKLKCLKSDTDI